MSEAAPVTGGLASQLAQLGVPPAMIGTLENLLRAAAPPAASDALHAVLGELGDLRRAIETLTTQLAPVVELVERARQIPRLAKALRDNT